MSGIEALLAQQIIGLNEAIDDRTASLLVAGTGISLSYNDGAGTLTIANTGLGGSTGSTDNRILRSDGTGGATVQNSAVTIDDSGNISGLGLITSTRAGAMGSTNPQNQIVVYGGFAGYGVGFDANGELSTVVNSVLKSTLGTNLRLSSNGSIQFNSATNLSGSNDVQILRNATGPSAEIRAAGGLSVRNADGSNWQTVNAYDGIFSNDVYVGVNRYIGGIGVQGFQFKANSTIATQLGATGRFCLGNDTSTGVALRGNGAGGLEVKLGDNSADAALACGAITASGSSTINAIPASGAFTLVPSATHNDFYGINLCSSAAGTVRASFWIQPFSGEIRIGGTNGGGYYPTIFSNGSQCLGFTTAGHATFAGMVFVGVYTVATLPSVSGNPGRLAQVTDSSVTTNGSTVAGGGSSRVPVFSDGTNWIVK